MYSFVFGLFSLALLFFYGMVNTFFFAKKLKLEKKREYVKNGSLLGIFGCLSGVLAMIVYYYGVG